MSIKKVPINERPRAKLQRFGPEKLSNIELFAVIINNGTRNKNVLEVAQELMYYIEDLNELKDITYTELIKIEGIGEVKALNILAVVELAKRMSIKTDVKTKFKNPEEVFNYFYPIMKDLKQEHLYAIYFDLNGKVLGIKKITEGGTEIALPDPKLIFKWAYRYQSSSFLIVHNHPTGNPSPSSADLKYTQELSRKAKVCDFNLIDHVIIGNTYINLRSLDPSLKIFM